MTADDFYAFCAGIPQMLVTETVSSSAAWLVIIDPADPHQMAVKFRVHCDKARLERAAAAFNAAMQDATEKEAAE